MGEGDRCVCVGICVWGETVRSCDTWAYVCVWRVYLLRRTLSRSRIGARNSTWRGNYACVTGSYSAASGSACPCP
jgi:hypothetical protein